MVTWRGRLGFELYLQVDDLVSPWVSGSEGSALRTVPCAHFVGFLGMSWTSPPVPSAGSLKVPGPTQGQERSSLGININLFMGVSVEAPSVPTPQHLCYSKVNLSCPVSRCL